MDYFWGQVRVQKLFLGLVRQTFVDLFLHYHLVFIYCGGGGGVGSEFGSQQLLSLNPTTV